MTTERPPTADAPSAADPGDPAVLQARIAELELRLRERVEEVTALHEETRVLLEERAVRDEFIRSMESDVLRLPHAERQLIDTDNAYKDLHARFEEYRRDAEGRVVGLELQIVELGHQVNAAQRRMVELEEVIAAFERRRAIVLSRQVRQMVRQVPGAAPAARAVRGAPPADPRS